MVWNVWKRLLGLMEPTADSESLADGLDDMIFFERRLNEVIMGIAISQFNRFINLGMHPKAVKWTVLLVLTCIVSLVASYYWIMDPSIRYVTFYESLWRHPFFTGGFLLLFILFTFCGIQKRVIAPSIIAARCRNVLVDFYLSCDESLNGTFEEYRILHAYLLFCAFILFMEFEIMPLLVMFEQYKLKLF